MVAERCLDRPHQERYNHTHQIILETASDFFWQQGFVSTSLDEVVEKAGVSKGAFYNHFESKKDVAVKILSEAQNRWIEAAEQAFAASDDIIPVLIDKVFEQEKLVFEQSVVRAGFALASESADQSPVGEKVREFLGARQAFYIHAFEKQNRDLGLILLGLMNGILYETLNTRDRKIYIDGLEDLRGRWLEVCGVVPGNQDLRFKKET